MTTYGENVEQDVISAKLDTLGNLVWTDYSWDRSQIQSLKDDLTKYVEKITLTADDLVSLSMRLGRLGRKLDFSGSACFTSVLRHTMGLLETALVRSETGVVHVIEGCTSILDQVTDDIDLIYSDKYGICAVDFTYVKRRNEGVSVLREDSHPVTKHKYAVLKTKFQNMRHEVCTFEPLFSHDMKVKFKKFRGCPREQDFQSVDHLTPLISKVTRREALEVLNEYSESMRHLADDHKGMVQTGAAWDRDIDHSLIKTISENGPSQASTYEKWRFESDSKPSFEKYYSGSFYDTISEDGTKRPFKLPLYERGGHHSSLERVVQIRDILLSRGEMIHPIITAVSEAVTKGKSGRVVSTLYPETGGVIAEQLYRDGEPFGAVRLTFDDNKSLFTAMSEQKTKTDSKILADSLFKLESILAEETPGLLSGSQGSTLTSLVYSCMKGTLGTDGLAEYTQRLMKGTLDKLSNTKISSLISQIQEISLSHLSMPRKRQGIKTNMGSFKGKSVVISVDGISDRMAVSFGNLGPATFGENSTMSYFVAGVENYANSLCYSTSGGLSRMLTTTQAMLDWDCVLLHRTYSYFLLNAEMRLSTQGCHLNIDEEIVMPSLLMILNSNKFAQAAEMIRYLFVNSTGLSSNPQSLYKKISWFSTRGFTQKLYIRRMCKLVDTLNVVKSHGLTDTLRLRATSQVPTIDNGSVTRHLEFWNVAMPHESHTSQSDHAIFNGFYVCRAMTMQRYNKLVSEALVLEKQLDSRDGYLETEKKNYDHELRFAPRYENKQALLSDLVPSKHLGGPWTPCWRTVYLGCLATALKNGWSDEHTYGEHVKECYDLGSVMREHSISQVMNSRGSVAETSPSGVMLTHREASEGKTITRTQNSKCWKTLLLAMQRMAEGKRPAPADYSVIADHMLDPTRLNLDLNKVAGLNDSLWPILIHFSQNYAMCVSKMVHKDQLGAREIAVLNAAARVMCFYVESLSRRIRDKEHLRGNRVNLIERDDKMEIVSKSLSIGKADRKMGRKVGMDSADCSKWGNSKMLSSFYQLLSCRLTGEHNVVLRNCLALFATKVFKIPDNFFLKMEDPGDKTDIVSTIRSRLANMSSEMGSLSNQIIKLTESMHQGILGCTSSVEGSDAQNLTNYVLEHLYKEDDLRVSSHITSDDYSRIYSWKSEKGFYGMTKETLSIHNQIMLDYGIKRNLEKSAVSAHMLEFNSVFFTYSGEFHPDVKQRLSFVDYGHSTDPQPNALRSVTQSAEYLRNDGGVVGACWIAVLNNSLALMQNQMVDVWHRLGEEMYKLPLELGGIVRPHPLRYVCSAPVAAYLENYDDGTGKVENQLGLLQSFGPEGTDLVSVEENEEHELKVLSMSRSGSIMIGRRPSRSSRALTEFLNSQEDEFFYSVLLKTEKSSLVHSLIACSHRETSMTDSAGSALRFASCQHSSKAKVYIVNCPILKQLSPEVRYSRDDLKNLIDVYMITRETRVGAYSGDLNPNEISGRISSCQSIIDRCRVVSVNWAPRQMHLEPVNSEVSNSYLLDMKLDEFDRRYNPLRGGHGRAWNFIESRELYKNKLLSLIVRKQTFNIHTFIGDQHGTIIDKLLKSNYVGGCRLTWDGFVGINGPAHVGGNIRASIEALVTHGKFVVDGERTPAFRHSFMSPRFPALVRKGMVGLVDLTSLLNILSGDTDYQFHDSRLKGETVDTLYRLMCDMPDKFVINPSRLTCNFTPIEYATSRMFKLIQRPLVGDGGIKIGREFIHYSETKWVHDLLLTQPKEYVPTDNSKDKYVVTPLAQNTFILVKPENHYGYFIVCTQGGQYVQIMSQSLIKPATIRLMVKGTIQDQMDVLEDLGVNSPNMSDLGEFEDIFLLAAGYYEPHVPMSTDLSQEVDITFDDPLQPMIEDSDEDESSDEDSGFFGDFFSMGGGVFDNIDMVAAEATVALIPVELEPDDQEEQEEFDDMPVTESSAIRPINMAGNVNYYANITRMNTADKRRLKIDRDYNVYSFDLPYQLTNTKFKDDDVSSLRKLIAEIEKLGDSEGIWLKGYVLNMLNMYGPIRAAFAERDSKGGSLDMTDATGGFMDGWN